MRLIDADALEELFRETIGYIAKNPKMTHSFEHMVRASAVVIEMIKDAPTIDSQGQWISVSERLPDRNKYVLVTDNGETDIGRRFDGRWVDCYGDKLKDVTAWMPLPEPYKEDEK